MIPTLAELENRPGELGTKLLEHLKHGTGAPLLMCKAGLAPTDAFEPVITDLLEQLESESGGPIVLTVLSNAVPELNPFSGLDPGSGNVPKSAWLESLVALLGPGRIHQWRDWPDHCLLFSVSAVEALAKPDTTADNAFTRLRRAGGNLFVSDSLFMHEPGKNLFYRDALDPHEQRRPTAWGSLTERLDDWLRHAPADHGNCAQKLVDYRGGGHQAVTLHVTHSWGGGVAQWVDSFIAADDAAINFQLRSEGPQSAAGCGQRYSLYFDNHLEAPVASWWLQPPIRSTDEENPAYRELLRNLFSRYAIGRIIVSSLVGHSLDALATGLPTIQVLHDFYPRWPLLGVHPGPYLEAHQGSILEQALQENHLLPEFAGRNASDWAALGDRWRETVVNWGVSIAAPSRSVADLLRQLDPAWSDIDFQIIPHGLPELAGQEAVLPRDRNDGRLRLVIPGRIQAGKGQRLLLEALPELAEHAQIYLLGAGKSGEVFFGMSGVHVITQYSRENLRSLLAAIGPHLAALLSIVPETFSYTLSEMLHLNIPVIATRVGSFEERIKDGESGWLIEPDATALIRRVRSLAANRQQISAVHGRLADFDMPGGARMVAQYGKICKPRMARRAFAALPTSLSTQAAALAFHKTELSRQNRVLRQKNTALQAEVEERSAWAEERERARKEEKELRIRWVSKLETHLEELDEELKLRDAALQETNERLEATNLTLEHEQGMLRQTSKELEQLRATHEWVLGSWSWRLSRPFRIVARVAQNLWRAQAWNPLMWPQLLSHSIRTIRTRGLRGAFLRSQLAQQPFLADSVDTTGVEAIGNSSAPESFPSISEPKVSLIIPVFNKWEYTAACLRSLKTARCTASFEVIVVDDQSTDETPRHLAAIDGLNFIRNEENLGFVGSCNRGAEAARGEFIVLLNNDTQVLDDWLDKLLETFDLHPDTGLAGARLVYPDGRLQEAGGIIFRDGSGWNYGKDANADRPEFQYCREVDYCSGACIMLPTGLFRELGGFDSHYAPAYYEDADLAFRVRAKGLEVRVQPASTIVHHEGITSGTDVHDNSGAKRFQAVNRDKFLDRWKNELGSFPSPIVDPGDEREVRRARDHFLAGRVLIVDAYTPEPNQDAGSLRLRHLMNCFRELGFGVTFLPDNRAFAGDYTTDLQQGGVEVVYDPWVGSLQRFFSERGSEFDFVMISRYYVASKYLSLLKRHCPQASFIFDTVDLHYLREERQAELENSLPLKRTAAQTRRSELAVINAADATLVVSPVEKTLLEESAPDARVHVISLMHEVIGSQTPFTERKDLFFVGGYQHPPNIDAATWFTRSIWPLIRRELPDVEFHLLGSKANEQVRALDGNGVRFHGFVEEIEPWVDNCRLAVAPLRYGAGIKGKVNSSMSRGQPVVATPCAVEGMFAKPGRDVLVAESAEEFAAEVIRLYQDEDLWNSVSVSGLENIRQYFSVETARLSLRELIRILKQSKT
jgi:GT2 family glycosyltransferase/glycosyltransferase involved in cell wall biosynthesis